MSNASALFRSLIVYGLCLPLAVSLGYLLANPLDLTTVAVVGIILTVLLIPLFLRWHHVWLIAAWNTTAVIFFLPGRPAVWQALAAISFCIGVLQYTINRNNRFLHAPSVARPLVFLAAVVLITARLTGGIGVRALGSTVYGGRNYVGVLVAVIGYFAFTSRQVPPKRAKLYVTLFFLATATFAIGELPRVLPSGFNFLFLVFPVMMGGPLTDESSAVAGPAYALTRVTGLSSLGLGVFYTLLVRYGIRGIFLEPGSLWRLVVFAASVVVGLMGGFRSALILMFMTFAILFYLERMHHTRLLPLFMIATLLVGALTIAFANRLPFSIQRSMAFLPLDLDPLAKLSAQTSTVWRLEVWRRVLPQVPQYLILGKGYGFSGREMDMIQDDSRGTASEDVVELVGDYHNGPLSVLIPFGMFGMIGLLWFFWASLRVLYQNYQFGDPAYHTMNVFLFAYFFVKVIFFFAVFGSLASDLMTFTGLVGLSVSLNGGVAKPVVVPQPKIVFNRFRLHPSAQRPVGV